jgi:hypothetical protein
MMFIRRMAILMAAGALAVGLSIAATGTAHALVNPDPNWNEIVSQFDHNFNNTLCVDDPGGSLTYGTPLQLWHCHGSGSNGGPQRWEFFNSGSFFDGQIEWLLVLADHPNVCIDYKNSVAFSGQRLVVGPCGPAPYDVGMWVMDSAPGTNPLMDLRDPVNNLCIAAADFSDNNGTPLIAKTCDPNDLSQIWWLG